MPLESIHKLREKAHDNDDYTKYKKIRFYFFFFSKLLSIDIKESPDCNPPKDSEYGGEDGHFWQQQTFLNGLNRAHVCMLECGPISLKLKRLMKECKEQRKKQNP
jgi:hypothetical protein